MENRIQYLHDFVWNIESRPSHHTAKDDRWRPAGFPGHRITIGSRNSNSPGWIFPDGQKNKHSQCGRFPCFLQRTLYRGDLLRHLQPGTSILAVPGIDQRCSNREHSITWPQPAVSQAEQLVIGMALLPLYHSLEFPFFRVAHNQDPLTDQFFSLTAGVTFAKYEDYFSERELLIDVTPPAIITDSTDGTYRA